MGKVRSVDAKLMRLGANFRMYSSDKTISVRDPVFFYLITRSNAIKYTQHSRYPEQKKYITPANSRAGRNSVTSKTGSRCRRTQSESFPWRQRLLALKVWADLLSRCLFCKEIVRLPARTAP